MDDKGQPIHVKAANVLVLSFKIYMHSSYSKHTAILLNQDKKNGFTLSLLTLMMMQ